MQQERRVMKWLYIRMETNGVSFSDTRIIREKESRLRKEDLPQRERLWLGRGKQCLRASQSST